MWAIFQTCKPLCSVKWGMRIYRRPTLENHRICNRCEQELPATPEIFARDASRSLGLAYECRACMSARKIGKDRRTERWANLTDAQRALVKARHYKYNRSIKGRACFLASAYRQIDADKGMVCDITHKYMLCHIFTQSCVYCGVTDGLGCDRLDNSRGHTMDNVVPACGDCNIMRGDRFTHEEMLIIGKSVAHVRSLRGILAT